MKILIALLPLFGVQAYTLWLTYEIEKENRKLEKRITAIEDQNNKWKKYP